MKLRDVYSECKEKYKEYVILIKCGNFYEALGDDAYLMNKIFGYKIKELSNINLIETNTKVFLIPLEQSIELNLFIANY